VTAARWLAAAALLAAAPPQEKPVDVTRETFARASIDLAQGAQRQELSLKYRTLAWSVENVRRMRQDPTVREQMNQRYQLALQSELVVPVPLALSGRRLDPDTYRIGIAMNEAGAWEATMLLDHDWVRFPIDLSESRHVFPYLAFTLAPTEEGAVALVFQWGSEYGRLVFQRS
jgi:hypothetical protein